MINRLLFYTWGVLAVADSFLLVIGVSYQNPGLSVTAVIFAGALYEGYLYGETYHEFEECSRMPWFDCDDSDDYDQNQDPNIR